MTVWRGGGVTVTVMTEFHCTLIERRNMLMMMRWSTRGGWMVGWWKKEKEKEGGGNQKSGFFPAVGFFPGYFFVAGIFFPLYLQPGWLLRSIFSESIKLYIIKFIYPDYNSHSANHLPFISIIQTYGNVVSYVSLLEISPTPKKKDNCPQSRNQINVMCESKKP